MRKLFAMGAAALLPMLALTIAAPAASLSAGQMVAASCSGVRGAPLRHRCRIVPQPRAEARHGTDNGDRTGNATTGSGAGSTSRGSGPSTSGAGDKGSSGSSGGGDRGGGGNK